MGHNIKTSIHLVKNKIKNKKNSYKNYLKKEDINTLDLPFLLNKPLISLILFANENYKDTLDTLKNQTNYDNYEIIVVSNNDIKCEASAVIIEYNCSEKEAYKIGLSVAQGEYIGFLNSDILLSENTLYYMMLEKLYYDFDMVYTDEDIIENGVRKNPFFKPCYSPHTLRSFNYIGFALIRKNLITVFNDYYSLLIDLSYTNIKVSNVERDLVHYKNRTIEKFEPIYSNINKKVSIIIPSKDNYTILERCIDSIRKKSIYNNYEIIVVDNGSNNENKCKYANIADKYVYEKMDFNFSKMCNIGAENAEGEIFLFLNDDTEIISQNFLDVMVNYAIEPQTGAVGCQLLYPNNKIQHCGVISIQNGPVHCFLGCDENTDSYFGRNKYSYNYSAVTGACLMIEKKKFQGFDEDLPVAYNDIDLCWNLVEKGYYNVVVNSVKLYHYESISRGDDRKSKSKLLRLYNEREKLYNKHRDFCFNDKFYNRNLTQHRGDFTLENINYINRGMFARVIINPEKYFTDKINYKIEYMSDGNMVNIGGWAYIDGKSTTPFIVIMTRSDVAVPVEANVEIRQDISSKFGKNLDLCGFSCHIDKNLFEKGCYQLGIMLVSKITMRKYIVLIDKRIDIKL